MRLLILGGEGMLGHKLYQILSPRYETWATFRGPTEVAAGLPVYANAPAGVLVDRVNAFDFHSIVRAFRHVRPDVVVNCIGIIKQLKEARDPVVSLTINSLLPHRLADLCGVAGCRFIHMSTDCVFSGRRGRYTESDAPDAQDLYGQSKLLGEVDRPGCLTLRTSLIGRDFRKRTGLLEWFLSQRGRTVNGYRWMILSGITTNRFADMIGAVIERSRDIDGLYHVASLPISKCDLLVKIRDRLKLDIEIEPVDGPRCDRSLDGTRFVKATGYPIPAWDELIGDLVDDPTPYDSWRERYATA